MQRTVAIAATISFLLLAALVPASARLRADDEPIVLTYYLHGPLPAGNVPTAVELATATFNDAQDTASVSAGSPEMNATKPIGTVPRALVTTSLANPEFRKNALVGYWSGEANGRVERVTAAVWASAPVDVDLFATVYGDGGVGLGGLFGSARAPLVAGAPQLVTFDFGEAAANVEQEMVFAVGVASEDQPFTATILYDGADHASSVTFHLTEPVPEPPLSWTPANGWGSVGIANATHAHRETSLAISPLDDDLLVACSPSGVPATDAGHSFFHVSRDGGATWEYLEVETGATDPRRFAFEGGDCDVAFDDAGTMYSADTWLGSLSVGSSRDGGHTWTGTSLASSAPIVDRPWLVGGPEGTVHVSWQDVQALMPSLIWYARSTDFGLTFTPAVPVASAGPDGLFTWEGNLVVSEDQQDLYLVYTRRAGPALGDLESSGPESVWVAASHDGGTTWTQHRVASMPNPASYLYPSLALDEGGQLHVVYASRTDVDRPIWYATSADGAVSWSAPAKVLAGVAGYSPWVVDAGEGDAAIQWYGTLDPLGNVSAPNEWYFFTARVVDGVVASAGPTTSTPIFVGVQGEAPEFNQLRLDSQGRIHLGASAKYENEDGTTGWAIFHQREG